MQSDGIPASVAKDASQNGLWEHYNRDETLDWRRLPAEGGLPAEEIDYGYDAFGNVALEGGLDTYGTASYTAIGQLTQVATYGAQELYSEFGYDAATELTSTVDTVATGPSSLITLADRAYTRDDAGNITKAATTSDTTATDTQCYAYDHLSELSAAWTPQTGDCAATPDASALGGPAPYLEQYGYDTATGNRLSATLVNGAASTQQVYAYPAAGAPQPHAVQSVTTTGSSNQTNTYGYDSAGDTMTRPGQTLTYDPTGKLASIDSGGSLQQDVYDASGTLLLRTDATGSTLFLGETELHQVSGSTDVSAVRTYSLAGKAVAERTTQPGVSGNGTLDWSGSDVDGTTDVEVDAVTGAVTRRYSDPFGNSRGSIPAWSSDHGFLNKPVDTSTGLTQLGARVYDATIGKFLTVDPILAPDNPQQDNGYDYSANNPITNTDPSGACYQTNMDALNFHTSCVGSVGRNNGNGAAYYVGAAPHAPGNSSRDYGDYAHTGVSAMLHPVAGAPVISDAEIQRIADALSESENFQSYYTANSIGLAGAGAYFSIASDPDDESEDVVDAEALEEDAAAAQSLPGGSMVSVRQLGMDGEALSGITKNTTHIRSLTKTASYRIPDQLSDYSIGEVKNVAKLSLTNQLKDFVAYSKQEHIPFTLYVRGSTELSGPLQDALESVHATVVRNLP